MKKFRDVSDVVAWRMCLGCGACAYACPDNRVTLYDFINEGIRPVVEPGDCRDCVKCLQICPAVESDFSFDYSCTSVPASFSKEWGPVLAIYEGHAADPDVRYRGSSGGVLTALGAFCIEKLGMHGVLHVGANPEDPIRNHTRLSTTRAELLQAVGSRYSPASVCNGLGLVENAPTPCAIIGKPSEIAAVRNARKLSPELDRNVGLTMSFFCAETPSTKGTMSLLEKLGLRADSLESLNYRGQGWPGHFAPTLKGQSSPATKIPYSESWAFLQSFRPWSVQLWPDGSGELADITCGDPWYQKPDGKNPGSSLIVVRTPRGKQTLEEAIKAGYIVASPAELWKLQKSQGGLLEKKGSVWGRRLTMQWLGLPTARLKGLHLAHCWTRLPLNEKLASFIGTFRRVMARKLRIRLKLTMGESTPVSLKGITHTVKQPGKDMPCLLR